MNDWFEKKLWSRDPDPAVVEMIADRAAMELGGENDVSTECLAECIAIAIAGLRDQEGRVLAARLADHPADHASLCWQIAKTLQEAGL